MKIQLPDDAPFTPAQRAWLDDFLAKALAEASAPASAADAVPVTVLYGTQTGNAEGLAKKLLKTLKKRHFEASIADMADYDRLYQALIRRVSLSDVSATFVMEDIKETTAVPV